MLAIAKPGSSSATLSITTREITVTYDPGKPLESRFDFATDLNGGRNYILVEADPDAETVVRLTLQVQGANGGQFSSAPILWSSYPGAGTHAEPPGFTFDNGQQTIIFRVPSPDSYFFPWWFRLNIDAAGLNGIVSPSFFIVRRPTSLGGENCTLTYDSTDGSFTLTGSNASLHEMSLLNTIFPFNIPIVLEGASFSSSATAQNPPIVWTTGRKPEWLSIFYDSRNPNLLTLAVTQAGSGQGAGFQLAIEYNGAQLLSPDPIIINATLGDG